MTRNTSGPIALDDFSTDEDDAQSASHAGSLYGHNPPRSQSRLYGPMRARPATNEAASSAHFIVMVPPADLPTESLPARSAIIASHARRGILLPLYPTLGGQLYALAREYGLPSVGGISLYLLDDGSGNLGPRVSDATWASLWSGFFEDDDADETAHQARESDMDLPRPSPLSYARRFTPTSPRRRLARVPSNASMSSMRSPSAAAYTLETGRLPIVGRFEWVVDPQRARWWHSFIGQGADDAPERTEPSSAPLPLRQFSGSGPRPLRLNNQPSPAGPRRGSAREMPPVPDSATGTYPSTRDVFDSVPMPPQPFKPPSHSASASESPSLGAMRAPSRTTKPKDDDEQTVLMLGTPFENETKSADSDAPSSNIGLDAKPTENTERAPSAWSTAEERVPPASASLDKPVAPSQDERPMDSDESAPKRQSQHQHTMSATVASLSAAASRFFGGRGHEDKREADAPTKPSESEEKPQTPTSPEHDVETTRERITEMERHSAQERRHAHRASVDVPRSVRRASARINEAVTNSGRAASSSSSPETSRVLGDAEDNGAPLLGDKGPAAGDESQNSASKTSAARFSRGKPPQPDRPTVGQHSVARKSIVRPPLRPADGDIFAATMNRPHENVTNLEHAPPRMGHQSHPSLRSPIVLDSNLPEVADAKNEPKVDPVQLSRQSSVEFDNTLGDLQRALELLSPRQRSRTSQAGKRGSNLARKGSVDSVQSAVPGGTKPTSRRLFDDEIGPTTKVPGLAMAAPISSTPMPSSDARGDSQLPFSSQLSSSLYGGGDTSFSSLPGREPHTGDAWQRPLGGRQEPWASDQNRSSLQMPSASGAAGDEPSSAYTIPEVQPLRVPNREAAVAPAPASGTTETPPVAMQLNKLGEFVLPDDVAQSGPAPPPKDTQSELRDSTHALRNPAMRAHEGFPPRAEDDWAKWSANAESTTGPTDVTAPSPMIPAPALRVVEDAENYVPESSVRMSADSDQYVRISQGQYIRLGDHGEVLQEDDWMNSLRGAPSSAPEIPEKPQPRSDQAMLGASALPKHEDPSTQQTLPLSLREPSQPSQQPMQPSPQPMQPSPQPMQPSPQSNQGPDAGSFPPMPPQPNQGPDACSFPPVPPQPNQGPDAGSFPPMPPQPNQGPSAGSLAPMPPQEPGRAAPQPTMAALDAPSLPPSDERSPAPGSESSPYPDASSVHPGSTPHSVATESFAPTSEPQAGSFGRASDSQHLGVPMPDQPGNKSPWMSEDAPGATPGLQPPSGDADYDSLMPSNQAQFSPNSNEMPPPQGRTTPPGEPRMMSVMSPMSPNTSKQSSFSLSSRSPRRLRHSASSDRLQSSPSGGGARSFLSKMSPKLKWGRKKKSADERKMPTVSAPIAAMPLPPSDDSEREWNTTRNSNTSIASVNKSNVRRSGAPFHEPSTLVGTPSLGADGEPMHSREFEQPNPVFRMGAASASLPTLALGHSPGDTSVSQLRSPFQGTPAEADNSGVFAHPDIPSPELHQSALGGPADAMALQHSSETPSLPPSQPSMYDARQSSALTGPGPLQPSGQDGTSLVHGVPRDASADARSAAQAPYGPEGMHPVNMSGQPPAVAHGVGSGATSLGESNAAASGASSGPNTGSIESFGRGAPQDQGALDGGSLHPAAAEEGRPGALAAPGNAGQGAADTLGGMGAGAMGAAGHAGHGAFNTVGHAGQGAMDTAGHFGGGAANTAGHVGSGAFHQAGDAGQGVLHTAGDVGSGAEHGAGNFAKKIPGLHKLSGAGKESSGKGGGMFSSLTAGSFRKS